MLNKLFQNKIAKSLRTKKEKKKGRRHVLSRVLETVHARFLTHGLRSQYTVKVSNLKR